LEKNPRAIIRVIDNIRISITIRVIDIIGVIIRVIDNIRVTNRVIDIIGVIIRVLYLSYLMQSLLKDSATTHDARWQLFMGLPRDGNPFMLWQLCMPDGNYEPPQRFPIAAASADSGPIAER
jgi:hypothetical protein